ncbi:MAG: PEF-CTERM sorting domain-containing protein [ANME-2 cluster archaeon]|nr:MAG: PEF-CTERM sorting domain-containing protein [ANME-2 cluster archaeon]
MEVIQMKENISQSYKTLTLGILVFILISIVPIASADVIDDFIFFSNACEGYGNAVWADADGIENGPPYGIYDTMVVFQTITGEGNAYNSPGVGMEYFFSGVSTICLPPGTTTWDKGRITIHFVDLWAPGFDQTDPSTWTYKSVTDVSIKTTHDLAVATDGIAFDDAYLQVKAYQSRGQINLISGTETIVSSWTQYDFSNIGGIEELYVTSDWAENTLDELFISASLASTDSDGDGLSDDTETAGWDISLMDCSHNEIGTLHVTSDPLNADSDGDGLNDFEEKEGWLVWWTDPLIGPLAYFVQSDPNNVDHDNDGINDFNEKNAGTNPMADCGEAADIDSDGDFISDVDELAGWDISIYNCDGTIIGTQHVTSDPGLTDTDSDGIPDYEERTGWHVSKVLLTGTVEYDVQSDPNVEDADSDGLTDLEERDAGTDTNMADTDCDSNFPLNDGDEVTNGFTDPLDSDSNDNGIMDGPEIDGYLEQLLSLEEAIQLASGSDSGSGNTNDIPEFPTVALPVIAVLGLMFLFQKRKGK